MFWTLVPLLRVTAKLEFLLQSDTATMRYWSDGMGAAMRQWNHDGSPQLAHARRYPCRFEKYFYNDKWFI